MKPRTLLFVTTMWELIIYSAAEVMYNLQTSFFFYCGCCTQHELQGMKENDRKQPWLPARTSWENILHSSTSSLLLPSPPSFSSPAAAAVRLGGSEQLLTKRRREREDGNAREMGVVLHGMKLTALHPANREHDTRQLQSIFSICGCLNALMQVQSDQSRKT